MTVQYAIVAFPRLDDADAIGRVRAMFDPLASMIGAHVTLVFPFECGLAAEHLHDHAVAATDGILPFPITLSAPTKAGDGYLFLRVLEGSQTLSVLHRRLYAGPLREHLSQSHAYEPHVTVGRLASTPEYDDAATRARGLLRPPLRGHIESIAVLRLADGKSEIELSVPFARMAAHSTE